jgi:hypothetical protein
MGRSEGERDEKGGADSGETPCIPGTLILIGYRTETRNRTVCRYEGGTQVCSVETYTVEAPVYWRSPA